MRQKNIWSDLCKTILCQAIESWADLELISGLAVRAQTKIDSEIVSKLIINTREYTFWKIVTFLDKNNIPIKKWTLNWLLQSKGDFQEKINAIPINPNGEKQIGFNTILILLIQIEWETSNLQKTQELTREIPRINQEHILVLKTIVSYLKNQIPLTKENLRKCKEIDFSTKKWKYAKKILIAIFILVEDIEKRTQVLNEINNWDHDEYQSILKYIGMLENNQITSEPQYKYTGHTQGKHDWLNLT